MEMTPKIYTGELVVDYCWCGIRFAVPKELKQEQQSRFNSDSALPLALFCPLGHSYVLTGPRRVDQLTKQLAEADQKIARLAEEKARAESANAKLKDRISKGMCPCCRRHFKNLRAHMRHRHPEYGEKDEKK